MNVTSFVMCLLLVHHVRLCLRECTYICMRVFLKLRDIYNLDSSHVGRLAAGFEPHSLATVDTCKYGTQQ